MHMESESGNSVEKLAPVQVFAYCQRANLVCTFDGCRTETKAILYRNSQTLHKGTSIVAKALLAWHQSIAVVLILLITHLQVIRGSNVVVRSNGQASPLALEKLLNSLYFIIVRFLIGAQAVQPPHHQRISIRENPFVQGQFISSLVNPLVHRNSMARSLSYKLLEGQPRPEKQFERSGDALLEDQWTRILG